MKYMLQIRFNGAELEKLTTREQDAIFAEYIGISRLPGVLDGNQLQPAQAATTVRVHDGETLITDGLPVDSAAVLDGYYLYEAPDLEKAIKLAARIPAARMGGTVEVRPVVEREATAAFPALTEGIVLTHFIVSDNVERSRRFYTDVLGGETVLGGEPTIVALANSWIIINLGGGPTDDKPAVTLETPRNPDRVSSFLNIRVADIQSIYEQWHARGAEFLTPPINRGREIRAYIRDPDGHLIEVGQTTSSVEQPTA
jgi:catechol 2,3-dioxygenase-like lactoylglutathione lyase family enzyme